MIELLAGGAAAASGLLSLGIFHPRFALFGPVVWHGRRDQRRVALSFDDGPHPDFTPRVAEALKAAQAKATFFCVGQEPRSAPGVARALLGAGHELANHTFTHDTKRDLFSAARAAGRSRALPDAAGDVHAAAADVPPGGRHQEPPRARSRARAGPHRRHLVRRGPRRCVGVHEPAARKLAARAQGGDILALHDGIIGDHQRPRREATLRHLPVLLAALRDRGFELSTVSSVL